MKNQYIRIFWVMGLILLAVPVFSQGRQARRIPSPPAALYTPAVGGFGAPGQSRPVPGVSRARQVEAAEQAAVKARAPQKSAVPGVYSTGALGNANYQRTSAGAKRDRLFNAPGRVNPTPKTGEAFVPKDKAGQGIKFAVPTHPVHPVLVPTSAPVTYTGTGGTLFSSDGVSYTQAGDTVFGSDANTYTQLGGTIFAPEAVTYTRDGGTLFGVQGTSYTRIGDSIFGTDGSSSTQFGGTVFTVGPTSPPPAILFP